MGRRWLIAAGRDGDGRTVTREQFEQERKRPTKRPSAPARAISDESQPDIAAIARDLDEERAARRAIDNVRTPAAIDDEEQDGAEEHEQTPPRSRRSG